MAKYALNISGDGLINVFPAQPEDGYDEGTKVVINVKYGVLGEFSSFSGASIADVKETIDRAVYEITMDSEKTLVVELKGEDALISIAPKSLVMIEGDTEEITITKSDEEVVVTEESLDELTATVASGVITAVEAGNTIVNFTGTLGEESDVDGCAVTVQAMTLAVTPETIDADAEAEVQIQAVANAGVITYESDNVAVPVSETGLVSVPGTGEEATITVTATNGAKVLTDTISVAKTKATVTLDANTGEFEDETASKDVVVELGSSYADLFTSEDYEAPTKAENVFDGWTTDAEGLVPVVDTDVISADITIYAKYAPTDEE